MTEKEDKERITRLEETVKHLVLCKQEEEVLADHHSKEMTLEEFHQKDQEHKTVFKKFLHWMAG